jgi:hypothetical protein
MGTARARRVTLRLIAAAPLDAHVEASLAARIRQDVDAELTLTIVYVTEILRTRSGKHRFVIGLT